MKKKIVIILSTLSVVLGIGAFILFYLLEYSKISYEFYFNDKLIATCKNAEILDLFPKPNGGYRFSCKENENYIGSVYLIYATSSSDDELGSIENITISDNRNDINNQYRAFKNFNNKNRVECNLNKELIQSSDSKVSKTFLGDIKKGEYRFATINPCGVVRINVDEKK